MGKLYSELSEIYEGMYASFIDYNEEYNFYSKILQKYHKSSVLEVGSGTGNLSKLFSDSGFTYLGLDLSADMLALAQKKNPDGVFIEGDMRNFILDEEVGSIIITARSVSYLLSSEDVNLAFACAHKNLLPKGIFSFDFIDANRFVPEILKGEKVIHKASFGGEQYVRESIWRLGLKYGMDFIWDSRYTKEVGGEYIEIGTDAEEVRTFTKNEIEIFLDINNFEILEMINRDTYAFPTYVVVAEKN